MLPTFFSVRRHLNVYFFVLAYLISSNLNAQELTTSNLPIIIIDTDGYDIPTEPKIPGTMKIIDNADGVNNITDAANDYDGHIGIELRGSSSLWLFPKKNYGLELWTASGADTSASVLGFPAEEDWVLHGPYSDKTLMRNFLTYQLYSFTGRYSTRSRFVEVVENGRYQGVYVFLEKIKKDVNRVDIAKLNPDENSGDDLTGGYIIKLDKYDGSNSRGRWLSNHRSKPNNDSIWFQYEYPKGDQITSAQEEYIQRRVRLFEDILSRSGSGDPNFGYPALIDEESFVDFALINELTRNVDGYRLSTFMYKDKDSNGGKLNMGPIWDFNLGFGNADYCNGWRTDGWAWDFNSVCPDDYWFVPFWWSRLMSHYRFVKKFHDRWVILRENEWSDDNIVAMIDSTANMLQDPATRNFQKWPTLGSYIWPNPQEMIGSTYQEEIDNLKQWILARTKWMDEHIADRYNIISSIDLVNEGLRTFAYPNPFTSRIVLESETTIVSYKIFSTQGQQLMSGEDIRAKKLVLNTDNLPPGIYMAEVTYAGGQQEAIRIIRQ